MRVHGDKVIRRRAGITKLNNYRNAKDMLREDFFDLCGYCGKNCSLMYKGYHIDHFVPIDIDPNRRADYYNLVLSCPKCNLIKSNKWPTKDKTLAHNDEIGFIDPASDEYDVHMERDEQGYVKGSTTLGKNMCEALNFHMRRTDLYWKIQDIYQIQEKLEQLFKQDRLTDEEKNYYMQTNIMLKIHLRNAYEAGE